MDSLIQNIRKISLNQTSVDELAESLEKFSVLGKRKSELEYQEFEVNFKKIARLNSFLVGMSESEKIQLIPKLKEFLDFLDKKTQYYLQEINWDCSSPEIIQESQEISVLFFKSLNSNNPFERFQFILDAYTKIQNIINDFGNN
jgi:hypothetical protein